MTEKMVSVFSGIPALKNSAFFSSMAAKKAAAIFPVKLR